MSSELPLLQLGAASPRMPLVTPTATGPACSTKTSRCFSLHRAHLRHHRRRPTFIPLLNRGSKRDEALILEEVSKYNSKDGCWLIIVGKRWVVASFHHHLPLGNSFYLCTKYTNFNYSSLHVQNWLLRRSGKWKTDDAMVSQFAVTCEQFNFMFFNVFH
ncbi:uncharacterized protein LOC123413649 isoform X2 [Hordeum vulgare subsp. vulgare]|uniref:uncharacterized protein LOC123413649 isoform X2 n=1 Tax=Hordeum vulgare subsp. vulgare TaxID=112509 RepID=UPI001D1A4E79|nr:uncharacterized protein LOC123413649 isoform X2 [Hordeum vulgare subsp. vulgare]